MVHNVVGLHRDLQPVLYTIPVDVYCFIIAFMQLCRDILPRYANEFLYEYCHLHNLCHLFDCIFCCVYFPIIMSVLKAIAANVTEI